MKALHFILLVLILPSCYTQTKITKSKEPITDSVLQGILPGKVYTFYFKDGFRYKVEVERVKNNTVYARTKSVYAPARSQKAGGLSVHKKLNNGKEEAPFVYTFLEIKENADRITTRKLNAPLSIIALTLLGITAYQVASYDVDLD